MDGSLCYSTYPTRGEAVKDLAKLRAELQDLVNVAEQDLADFDETMKIVEGLS